MKTIDDIGLKLCELQADLFEVSCDFLDCSSPYFINIFMNSNLALRMDNPSFILESKDVVAYLEELKETYKLKTGKDKYPKRVLKWIGFLYRYYAYTYNLSSKVIYKQIKPKELYGLYESYHSLDPVEAISRIRESKQITEEVDYLKLAEKYFL